MTKTLSISLALLFALSAGAAAAPAVYPQRVFLWVSLTTAAEGSFGPDLHVYDGGLVMFESREGEFAATVDAAAVEAMRQLVQEPSWQKLLAELQAKEYPYPSDQPGIYIQTDIPGGMFGTFLPASKIPDELRPHLRRIDELLTGVFGADYPVRLAELREPRMIARDRELSAGEAP